MLAACLLRLIDVDVHERPLPTWFSAVLYYYLFGALIISIVINIADCAMIFYRLCETSQSQPLPYLEEEEAATRMAKTG